jgi:hypothetical protein
MARRRGTVRTINVDMVNVICDAYQPLVTEALAAIIRRQAMAGKHPHAHADAHADANGDDYHEEAA